MKTALEIVNHYYDAINRRDWGAYEALVSPGCVTTGPGGFQRNGIEGTMAFDKGWVEAMSDICIRPQRQAAQGELVASENKVSGTHDGVLHTPAGDVPPTGRSVESKYVGIFTVRDGKITSQTIYYDQVEILTALGLMPPAETD